MVGSLIGVLRGLLKKIFSSEDEINLEDFSKDKLANEKWIEHYFLVYTIKPEGASKDEYSNWVFNQQQELHRIIMGQIVGVDSQEKGNSLVYRGSMQKNTSIKRIGKSGQELFLIRFPDRRKTDKNKVFMLFRSSKPESYLFTPIQSIHALKILPSIEFGICAFTGIKPNPSTDLYLFKKGKPYFQQSDGIQFFEYPLEKRIELYAKSPTLEKLVFKSADNDFFFKDFIEALRNRVKDNPKLEKYHKAVERLLKEYKIEGLE